MFLSGIVLKKVGVFFLNNYIENVVVEDDDNYKLFRNFIRGFFVIFKIIMYEKVKVIYDEYRIMMKVFEEDKNYLGMVWLVIVFNVGVRRVEIIQFKIEILNYEIFEG